MIVLFVMSGVFSFQGLLNVYLLVTSRASNHSGNYQPIGRTPIHFQMKMPTKILLASATILGIFFQVGGLGAIIGFAAKTHILPIGIIMLVCLLVLAFTWTNTIQKLTFRPSEKDIKKAKENGRAEIRAVCGGRWKACEFIVIK